MAKKQKRWGAFQRKTIQYVLPSKGIEVTLKEPDVLGIVMKGGLPDAFFNMFAEATKEGELDGTEFMQKLNEDEDASESIITFIDMIALEAFVEPRLVRDADEADYETTVPLEDIPLLDRFSVVSQLDIMGGLQNLGSLDQFRTQPNGAMAPPSQSEDLQPVAESDTED